jgi:hypothetical protein
MEVSGQLLLYVKLFMYITDSGLKNFRLLEVILMKGRSHSGDLVTERGNIRNDLKEIMWESVGWMHVTSGGLL